jgi:type III pantothenate kinase
MLLAIDIGNTNITLGLFQGKRLARTFSLPTQSCRSGAGLARRLRRYRAAIAGTEQAILCGVVPWATPKVAKALRSIGLKRVRVVGRDINVPLKNRYRYPKQVGHDRLVGAYAAWREFGKRLGARGSGLGRDCIVCDFGTAITIDVVTKAGEYLGGIIAPGLEISLEALANRTALLPRVALREPPELLGRDTANSIRSGILHGCAALCDGLVARLKRQYAPKAVVVATGGASPLLARHARTIDRVRPHLVLEGLLRLSFPSSS